MADVWLPGAYRDPGVNAGYNAGHSQMIRTVAHYTVGNDSRNTGRDGYMHFLVHKDASRENGCTQYAEIDAITWHAADAGNPYGPGIEWERMTTGGQNDEGLSNADPLTDNQLAWGAKIIEFCAEWGIPAELYDGPRFEYGNWAGWINHHDIDDQRSDGLLRYEWDQMCGGARPHPDDDDQEDDDMAYFVGSLENPAWGIYLCDGIGVHHVPNPKAVDELVRAGVVKNHDVRQINADGWTALINYDQR
jgi:hypothetical protein